MSNTVRGWQFRPATEEMEPEPGKPVDPKPRRPVESTVLVEVRVDAGGGVADAKVIRSAPPFDEPARDAARRWTFRPTRVHGASVARLAYIVFAFRQPITVTPGTGSE